jgi:hypothetical protein
MCCVATGIEPAAKSGAPAGESLSDHHMTIINQKLRSQPYLLQKMLCDERL